MSTAARAITGAEETRIRAKRQNHTLYGVVSVPNVIYTAQMDGTPASYDMLLEIDYKNGSGTLGDVKVGMEIWAGSTSGANDRGRMRVRKTPTASVFYVGEVADAVLSNNTYLTVVDIHGIWPKHIRIGDNEVFYMDGDITYTNQHDNLSPLPIMGPSAVLDLKGAASVSLEIDASDSTVIGSSISSYSWSAPGASSTGSMTSASPSIDYDTVGQYVVYCTVTAANGKSTTGARRVYVVDTLDTSSYLPIRDLSEMAGSIDDAGWSFAVSTSGLDESALFDQAEFIVFVDDNFDGDKTGLGQISGRENILAHGWIVEESIEFNAADGTCSFRVRGGQHWLEMISAFTAGLELKPSTSSNWTQMTAMTVDKALYHLLYWRSTLVNVCDVILTGDSRYLPEIQGIEGTLLGQIRSFAMDTILAHACFDRFNRFYVFVDPQLTPEADRTWATIRTLEADDWANNIIIMRQPPQTSRVATSGISSSSQGNVKTFFSLSPGHTFKRRGYPKIVDRLLLSNQSQSNTLAGLICGYDNNPYPAIEINLSGHDRMMDICPPQFINLGDSLDGNPRGADFTNKNVIPRDITIAPELQAGTLDVTIISELETFPENVTDGDVPKGPDKPPKPPPWDPPLPPLPPPPPGDPPTGSVSSVLMISAGSGFLITSSFSSSQPEWGFWNTGLSSTAITNMRQFHVTPGGAVYGLACGDRSDNELWYSPSVGGNWTLLLDHATMESALGYSGSFYAALGVDKNHPDHACIIYGDGEGSHDQIRMTYYYSGVAGGTQVIPYVFNSNTPKIVREPPYAVNNRWYYGGVTSAYFWTIGIWYTIEGGATVNVNTNGSAAIVGCFWVAGTTATLYRTGYQFISRFDEATSPPAMQQVINSVGDYNKGLISDPTGQYVWTHNGTGVTFCRYSVDYGENWSTDSSMGISRWRYATDGNPTRLIAAYSIVQYTEAFPGNWVNKTGDLLNYVGIPAVVDIQVIGNEE